ncbi:hypothetical protein HYS54_00910 [Candidatus Micrarchaeota archaeon]|nr:hypothetical protein [Candidatus Micrarchaeota archaeon]
MALVRLTLSAFLLVLSVAFPFHNQGWPAPPQQGPNLPPYGSLYQMPPYDIDFLGAQISHSFSDPDGSIARLDISFGDGSQKTLLPIFQGASIFPSTISHKYPKTGVYTLQATATDNRGATFTNTTHAVSTNAHGSFSWVDLWLFQPNETIVGVKQGFYAYLLFSSRLWDPAKVSCDWDFGDGSSSNACNLVKQGTGSLLAVGADEYLAVVSESHAYQSKGVRVAKLRVTWKNVFSSVSNSTQVQSRTVVETVDQATDANTEILLTAGPGHDEKEVAQSFVPAVNRLEKVGFGIGGGNWGNVTFSVRDDLNGPDLASVLIDDAVIKAFGTKTIPVKFGINTVPGQTYYVVAKPAGDNQNFYFHNEDAYPAGDGHTWKKSSGSWSGYGHDLAFETIYYS